MPALVIIVILVVVSTAVGLFMKARAGRSHAVEPGRTLAGLPQPSGPVVLGERATLVQFSTEFCSRCPATRRALADLAARHQGVAVIEVDLTHDARTASRFSISQTPTVLLADASGAVLSRVGGVPRIPEIERQIAELV